MLEQRLRHFECEGPRTTQKPIEVVRVMYELKLVPFIPLKTRNLHRPHEVQAGEGTAR